MDAPTCVRCGLDARVDVPDWGPKSGVIYIREPVDGRYRAVPICAFHWRQERGDRQPAIARHDPP
jgi:hypothetical protein